MSEVLQQLDDILSRRRSADAAKSYVASLHRAGLNRILEKVGEEATEFILAAKDAGAPQDAAGAPKDNATVIAETADLWFHSMVALSHLGLDSAQVLAELERRFGCSGLEEKASREV